METRGERWHREAERHIVRDSVALLAMVLAVWGIFTIIGYVVSFGITR